MGRGLWNEVVGRWLEVRGTENEGLKQGGRLNRRWISSWEEGGQEEGLEQGTKGSAGLGVIREGEIQLTGVSAGVRGLSGGYGKGTISEGVLAGMVMGVSAGARVIGWLGEGGQSTGLEVRERAQHRTSGWYGWEGLGGSSYRLVGYQADRMGAIKVGDKGGTVGAITVGSRVSGNIGALGEGKGVMAGTSQVGYISSIAGLSVEGDDMAGWVRDNQEQEEQGMGKGNTSLQHTHTQAYTHTRLNTSMVGQLGHGRTAREQVRGAQGTTGLVTGLQSEAGTRHGSLGGSSRSRGTKGDTDTGKTSSTRVRGSQAGTRAGGNGAQGTRADNR
jgi:hypothetical protein